MRRRFVEGFLVFLIEELTNKSVRITFYVLRNVLPSTDAFLRLHEPQCARRCFISKGLISFSQQPKHTSLVRPPPKHARPRREVALS